MRPRHWHWRHDTQILLSLGQLLTVLFFPNIIWDIKEILSLLQSRCVWSWIEPCEGNQAESSHCVTGYEAVRDENRGSPFIRAIHDVFRDHAKSDDILSLLTRVDIIVFFCLERFCVKARTHFSMLFKCCTISLTFNHVTLHFAQKLLKWFTKISGNGWVAFFCETLYMSHQDMWTLNWQTYPTSKGHAMHTKLQI